MGLFLQQLQGRRSHDPDAVFDGGFIGSHFFTVERIYRISFCRRTEIEVYAGNLFGKECEVVGAQTGCVADMDVVVSSDLPGSLFQDTAHPVIVDQRRIRICTPGHGSVSTHGLRRLCGNFLYEASDFFHDIGAQRTDSSRENDVPADNIALCTAVDLTDGDDDRCGRRK